MYYTLGGCVSASLASRLLFVTLAETDGPFSNLMLSCQERETDIPSPLTANETEISPLPQL